MIVSYLSSRPQILLCQGENHKITLYISLIVCLFILFPASPAFAGCKIPKFNNFFLHEWSVGNQHKYNDPRLGVSYNFESKNKKSDYYIYPGERDAVHSKIWEEELRRSIQDIYAINRAHSPNSKLSKAYRVRQKFSERSNTIKSAVFFLASSEVDKLITILGLGFTKDCFHKIRYTARLAGDTGKDGLNEIFEDFQRLASEIIRSAQRNIKDCPSYRHPEKSPYDKCFGRYTFQKSGDVYIGEFQDDQYHGYGTFVQKGNDDFKGYSYTGYFSEGMRDGFGVYTYPNGSRYVGHSANNQRSGIGTMHSANGDKYTGQWELGEKHGKGTYEFANGGIYTGEFKRGFMEGIGTYKGPNGTTYTGDHKNDRANGQGVMTFSDGRKYEGEFRDDEPYGKGQMTDADGKITREMP